LGGWTRTFKMSLPRTERRYFRAHSSFIIFLFSLTLIITSFHSKFQFQFILWPKTEPNPSSWPIKFRLLILLKTGKKDKMSSIDHWVDAATVEVTQTLFIIIFCSKLILSFTLTTPAPDRVLLLSDFCEWCDCRCPDWTFLVRLRKHPHPAQLGQEIKRLGAEVMGSVRMQRLVRRTWNRPWQKNPLSRRFCEKVFWLPRPRLKFFEKIRLLPCTPQSLLRTWICK